MTSCDVYVHLKPNFQMKKYLLCLSKKQYIAISRFRTNNTHLPQVIGRFKEPKVKRYKRFCTLCNENKLGEEYHILFEWTFMLSRSSIILLISLDFHGTSLACTRLSHSIHRGHYACAATYVIV